MLNIVKSETREAMGAAAAAQVAAWLREVLSGQPTANVIFAAAPSQNDFLAALTTDGSIDWPRINGFHMDEYVGLASAAPQLFGNFLKGKLFDKAAFRSVFYIDSQALDPGAECARYAALLRSHPPDLVCMGIGENAHIAFNDPPVADFRDPAWVKIVSLDDVCRQQQVNDGCFARLDDVPEMAITLTIPALVQARFISCVVPGIRKRRAVADTLHAPISENVPSTILRTHPDAILFVDNDSI
ncbi:MAG TPA: 6-phosphogluconolactonase [Dinghuibacter sp.]|uniref:6-phosphogluconolactonase n=1 Tax=Dinghuibacter sp. TaxID=2024697 RepID=UPI002B6972F0|nr:6-phosphogluconolactonase [Dinghuibacter sp.]HTJ11306.1 6-phosphogluconolactonase [Dinghuibacter sp.]